MRIIVSSSAVTMQTLRGLYSHLVSLIAQLDDVTARQFLRDGGFQICYARPHGWPCKLTEFDL
jgi:hypothetical protein